MALPNAKMKINKGGVQFQSNVEAVEYSIAQLTKAALRDTAKFLRKRMIEKLKALPGMKKSKRLYSSMQYWVRKKENDLKIGLKHDTWYGTLAELGDKGQPKRSILRDTTYENVEEIQRIQAQYLTALNEDRPNIPSEEEYKSEGEE